jgi:hypothetical protein
MSNKDFNMREYIDIVNEANEQLDEFAPIVPIVKAAGSAVDSISNWAKDKAKDWAKDNMPSPKRPGNGTRPETWVEREGDRLRVPKRRGPRAVPRKFTRRPAPIKPTDLK